MNQRRACDLVGKQGLILGIANKDSIAFGCAKAFRSLGADLAITYKSGPIGRTAHEKRRSLFTMSFYGAEKVVAHYNLMGPVKAALEASVRYMAHELGPKGIRVYAISPGPVKTRAASGVDRFDELMNSAADRAPLNKLLSIDDVGMATAMLATDAAKPITGVTQYIDGGYHILG